MTGRQLARVSSVKYHETVWSNLYAGNQHTVRCLKSAVLATESSLELAPQQRKRVVWRMDGGGGSDENLRWLLARDYQVMAKGLSNRRAEAWANQVSRWDAYQDVFLAEIPSPIDLGRPVRIFIKKRLKADQFCYSYYVSTLQLPAKGCFMSLYDQRGGAEVEQFRNDKMGLHLASRRKNRFLAQKALILLTDLAHNLLANFHHQALVNSKFEPFAQKRIIRDLLQIPGFLVFENDQLKRIELLQSHPNSKPLLICLEKYISGD